MCSQINSMILHFDSKFCINSLQWRDVFSLQVCIPHVLKAVLSKEDCCDISMEAEPYLCMDPSSLVLTELRG
jgi:hypothetical protein